MFGRTSLSGVLVVSLFLALAAPAPAQTLTVQNGGTITVKNGGVWDLNGTTVGLGGTGSTASIAETGGGRFTGGKLTATRDLNAPSQANPAGLGIEISSGQNLGATTVTRGHVVQQAPNNNESIARFYDISPSQNDSDLSATLTHHYADPELNNLSESTLELFKSTDGGSTWTEEGADSRSSSNNTVTLNGISSFCRWTLGSTQSLLPVELAAFEATVAKEKTVELTWRTVSETNNAGFEVQHRSIKPSRRDGSTASSSATARTWEKIGFVESKAQGSTSSEASSYRFTAEDLPVGTHRFRLKQVDLDGSAHLSEPVVVELEMQQPLRLSAPAPNPVSSSATVRFAVREKAQARMALYNVLGQKVRTLYRGPPPAGQSRTVRLEVGSVPSGVYFLHLRADGQAKMRRLTVVR